MSNTKQFMNRLFFKHLGLEAERVSNLICMTDDRINALKKVFEKLDYHRFLDSTKQAGSWGNIAKV
jgi:hypothetical protein